MASAITSVWEKAVQPPAHTLLPDTSGPLDVSGAFQTAAPVQDLRDSVFKSVPGPFKRNCLRLQKLCLSRTPCPFLQLEVMSTSLPGFGTLGCGGLVWGRDPYGYCWVLAPSNPSTVKLTDPTCKRQVHTPELSVVGGPGSTQRWTSMGQPKINAHLTSSFESLEFC